MKIKEDIQNIRNGINDKRKLSGIRAEEKPRSVRCEQDGADHQNEGAIL